MTFLGIPPIADGPRVILTPGISGRCVSDPVVTVTTSPQRIMEQDVDRVFCAFTNEDSTNLIRIGGREVASGVTGFAILPRTGVVFDGCQGEMWAVSDAGSPKLSMLREQKVRL